MPNMLSYLNHPPQKIEVDVDMGDSYLKRYDLNKIDFLKLDVEGMEIQVLKGFSEAISKGAIRFIQFEYGRLTISARKLLKDFYEILAPNYFIGKIYPNFVNFKDYEWSDEDFIGPNFLAVKNTEVEALHLLSGNQKSLGS